MISKRILHIAQLSAVGLVGYYVGQKDIFNGNKEDSIVINGKKLTSMPGLPIFGTVSAATPFVEGGTAKDRVCSFKMNQTFFVSLFLL